MRGGRQPPRLLELAIASERARDSERASEAEGRLKRGVRGGFSPPGVAGGLGGGSPPADASAIWETGGPRGAQRAHLGGPTGCPRGPRGGPWGAQRAHLGGPRGAQGAHEGANTFPGKEIYPVKIDIFPESLLCPAPGTPLEVEPTLEVEPKTRFWVLLLEWGV